MLKFWPRAVIGVLGLSVLASSAAFSLQWRHGRKQPEYITAELTRGDLRRGVDTTATISPLITVQLASYNSGIIKWVGCDFNTEVKAGQICARLDPEPFQLKVDQDKTDIATSQATLQKDQANLAYVKLNYERDRKLLQKGVVSQDTVDVDQNNFEQAKQSIISDQMAILSKNQTLHTDHVSLDRTAIISPVNGTVITRTVDVGQAIVSNNSVTPLFLIAQDLSKMQIETNVSEADIAQVKMGQKASFTVQAFPERSFSGVVRQIRYAPINVQGVITYNVIIAVDNADRVLFPGMTAEAQIITKEHDGVLRVPLRAVRFTPKNQPLAAARPANRVWILRDGKIEPRPVTKGLDDGTLIEISGEGLGPGDKVVTGEDEPQMVAHAPVRMGLF